MQQVYHIDMSTGILRRRSGRWLRARISGLLDVPSRLDAAMKGKPPC